MCDRVTTFRSGACGTRAVHDFARAILMASASSFSSTRLSLLSFLRAVRPLPRLLDLLATCRRLRQPTADVYSGHDRFSVCGVADFYRLRHAKSCTRARVLGVRGVHGGACRLAFQPGQNQADDYVGSLPGGVGALVAGPLQQLFVCRPVLPG